MRNIEVVISMIDGSFKPIKINSGKDLISKLCNGNKYSEMVALYIKAKTQDKKKNVTIYIENSSNTEALVLISDND